MRARWESINQGARGEQGAPRTRTIALTEFLHVAEAVRIAGKHLTPYSPYFGPGYSLALWLAAVLEEFSLFEYLNVAPEAWHGLNTPASVDAKITIPDKPGVGVELDADAATRYKAFCD